MQRVITTFCAAAMAVTSIAAFAGASQAAPMPTPTVQKSSDVTQIRDRGRFERRGNDYYYNGQRGDRRRHAGWRQYNGYYFPPAAFLGGVIVGGLLDDSRPVRYNNRHYRWCENNRPNYRVSDNTFKPVGAPRRSCNSPFD